MQRERGGAAVLISWPDPGRALPQLIRRLGAEAAAQVAEAMNDDLVESLLRAHVDVILYAADRVPEFRQRYAHCAVRRQAGLSLCFEDLLARRDAGIVVRTGHPGHPPRIIQAAFEMLARRDAIAGADGRGGIHLLGMRVLRPVFGGLSLDAPDGWERLAAHFSRQRVNAGLFPPRSMVETYEDLLALRVRVRPDSAPRTCHALRSLGFGLSAAVKGA